MSFKIYADLSKSLKYSVLKLAMIGILILTHQVELSAQSKTYVGIRGGSQISFVTIRHNFFRAVVNPRYTSGTNMGIIVKHYRNQNVGIQTGVEYVQKGWKQFFFDFYPVYTARINYLEVPFLLTAHIGSGKTKFFINMGPFMEFLVGSDLDADPGDVEPFDFYTYDSSRDDSFGYGLRGGGGVSYDFPFGQVHLETFFSFSLTNVFDPVSKDSPVPDVSNNFVAGISLAYLIPFGKLVLVNSKKNKNE
jgi:hypothetical protein